MKKICIVDLLFPKGHSSLNSKILDFLSKDFSISYLIPDNSYAICNTARNCVQPDLAVASTLGPLESRTAVLKNMKIASDWINDEKPDFVLILTFDTIAMAFSPETLKRTTVYVFHHRNPSELFSSSVKRFFFDFYKRNINHIVFEPFIKNYLVSELNVNEENISIFPHPFNEALSYTNIRDDFPFAIGLSGSNDPKFIDEIIELEESEHLFENNKLGVLLKSSGRLYSSDYLNVTNSYFSQTEYSDLFRHAPIVLNPLSSSFKYRVSGVLIEALGSNHMVLSTQFQMAKEYARQYPHAVFVEDTPSTFCSKLLSLMESYSHDIDNYTQESAQFRADHSDNACRLALQAALLGGC